MKVGSWSSKGKKIILRIWQSKCIFYFVIKFLDCLWKCFNVLNDHIEIWLNLNYSQSYTWLDAQKGQYYCSNIDGDYLALLL